MKSSEVIERIRFYWHITTKKFQKIFLYLQWFNKTYIHCFPSLETIAAACECSRRTVSRSLAYFEEHNWISRIRRPYQSNIYELHPDLLEFDCFDNNNFKKTIVPKNVAENVPQNVPVLESSNPPSKGTCTGEVPDIESEEREKPKIHPCLRVLRLTEQEKVTLTRKFAEYHLANAIDDAKWYQNAGKRIQNVMAFIYSRANKSLNRRTA